MVILVSATISLTPHLASQVPDVASIDFTQRRGDNQTEQLKNYQRENATLRGQIDNYRNCLDAWGDNAAEANAEAEVFRRNYEVLKLRMEALGVVMVGGGNDLIEQRLLRSVRDMDLLRQQSAVVYNELLALAEVTLRYVNFPATEDTSLMRREINAELRNANQVLDIPSKRAEATGNTSDPSQSGLVLGCKEELSLLVANFGRIQGARVGMPLRVTRGNEHIAQARIIQVRERISGALVEVTDTAGVKPKAGDQIRILASN